MNIRLLPALIFLGFSGSLAAQQPVQHHAFDGFWEAVYDCPSTSEKEGARSAVKQFLVKIEQSKVEGAYLSTGAPGNLQISGSIEPSGVVEMQAQGYTADSRYNVNRAASGTFYKFKAKATLGEKSGSGERIEGRRCTFVFTKRNP